MVAETITRAADRLWAREILRFGAVFPPTVSALVFSASPHGAELEYFAALIPLAAFALDRYRSSAGYAIAGGVSLFMVLDEVGFRHFASSVGFPIVLIGSGITLLALAVGLLHWLPRLRALRWLSRLYR